MTDTSSPLLRPIQALRRHWWKALSLFLILTSLALAIILVMPRGYESTGVFFVRLGRGAVTLDPTATTSKTVNFQATRESEINSVADILSGRGMLERVVDRIGPDRILKSNALVALPTVPEMPSFGTADLSEAVEAGQDLKALKLRDKAVRRLDKTIKIRPTRKAATIRVTCRASSPQLAREIVRTLMDIYLDVHISAHRTEGAHDFFEEHFALQEQAVEAATNAIRDFKNEIQVTSIPGERDGLQSQINQVDSQIISIGGTLAAAEDRVATLRSQYRSLDDTLVTAQVDGHAHEGNDLMRDRLFALQIEEKELLSRYTPDHPLVRTVREQLGKARQVYSTHPEQREQITTSVNPTKMQVEERLLAAIADQKGFEAEINALKDKRQELMLRLERLNRHESQLAQLDRELSIAKNNHRIYAEKREEARINRELDMDRISNVKIVQAPTLVLKAASPKRRLLFAVSTVLAMGLAVGLAQLLESSDDSFHTSEQLADELDIPVLVTLPRTPAKRVMAH